MFNIVLVQPEIPQNTGNISRTCAVTGCRLHLVRPLGFSVDDRYLKRAGLDYWNELEIYYYDSFEELEAAHPDARFHLLSTHAEASFAEAQFLPGDFLVFGKETRAGTALKAQLGCNSHSHAKRSAFTQPFKLRCNRRLRRLAPKRICRACVTPFQSRSVINNFLLNSGVSAHMIKEVAAMAKIESHNTLEKILENGIIAISRGNYGDTLLRAVDAAARGGIKAVEITFEQNLAPEIAGEALDKLVRRFGTVLAVGAGTVLTLEQLSIAAQAGAKYIVSPNSDCYIIKETKRRGLISIPGAMTPTEITAAHAAGADIVKLFPAGALGVEYFKAIKAPLRHIPVAAVGGVTPENLLLFKKAGACAYGISTGIFNAAAIKSEDYERVRLLAREYVRLAAQQD